MPLKQQSALEFVITYSWAMIIISIFVVFVFVLSGTSPPTSYLQSTCNIQPLIPCTESLVSFNSVASTYYIVFENQLGSVMLFPGNALNISVTNVGNTGRKYSYGSCSPEFAGYGASILCNATINGVKLPSGSQTVVDFSLNYRLCTSGGIATCGNDIYSSSGYSIQQVAPSKVSIDSVAFNAYPTGEVIVNGVTYFSNTLAYFPSGNYIIYAQPGLGYSFSSWSVSGPPTYVASTTSQNTTLALSSNAFVTANFRLSSQASSSTSTIPSEGG